MKVEVVNLETDRHPQYRLGDAVLKRDRPYGRRALENVTSAAGCFEGSLLLEYSRRIDPDSNAPQWEVLAQVVHEHNQASDESGPEPDELVAHLRLGNAKGFDRKPEVFVDYIETILAAPWPAVSRVSVVTAIHYGALFIKDESRSELDRNTEEHRRKVREIMGLFAARGIDAKLVSHPEVDTDFRYLAKARVMVLGNGHFSLCAAMVSNAYTFVPPWARPGADLDINALLRSRAASSSRDVSGKQAQRAPGWSESP